MLHIAVGTVAYPWGQYRSVVSGFIVNSIIQQKLMIQLIYIAITLLIYISLVAVIYSAQSVLLLVHAQSIFSLSTDLSANNGADSNMFIRK